MTKPKTLQIKILPPLHDAIANHARAAGISMGGWSAKVLSKAVAIPQPVSCLPKGPPGTDKRIPTKARLTVEQLDALTVHAHAQGVSRSKVVSDAVDSYLEGSNP